VPDPGVRRKLRAVAEREQPSATAPSALKICVLFYLAMVGGVVVLGYMVHWMAETYAAVDSSVSRGVTLSTYTASRSFWSECWA
jgi:hypothetical protein